MTVNTMRTATQVVQDLEKVDAVLREAQTKRELLMKELEEMSTFTADAVTKFTRQPSLKLIPGRAYPATDQQAAGTF